MAKKWMYRNELAKCWVHEVKQHQQDMTKRNIKVNQPSIEFSALIQFSINYFPALFFWPFHLSGFSFRHLAIIYAMAKAMV